MSYPYPQNRSRDRREKGEEPYRDAKEAMRENEAQIQTEAEAEREARVARETRDRLRQVGENIAERRT